MALITGTTGAIIGENAFSNDISKFRGKQFREIYEDGNWKLRFFKRDEFEHEPDEYEICKIAGNDNQYWLQELTKEQFLVLLDKSGSDPVPILVLVEFNKNWDLFGRSKTYARIAEKGEEI